MARKSRKKGILQKIEPEQKKKHVAGAYVRISDRSDESIENQEAIIMDFLANHSDIELHKVYADKGISSFSDIRPGYDALLNDVQSGIINCIIVKDLSRLGRSYLEIGELVFQTLPEQNVRFISITDQYDNNEGNRASSLLMPIKSIINYAYSKDISEKVKSTVKLKQQTGTYIAAAVPFGYKKVSSRNSAEYVPDGETAAVVTVIFSSALEGKSAYKIAGILNDREVPSPASYRARHSSGQTLWTRRAVMDILRNQFYTGALVIGRTRTPDYDMRHPKRMPPAEWSVFEDHHTPIVSKEVFLQVQTILNMRRSSYSVSASPQHGTDAYLGAILYCGHCGRKMKRRSWQGKTYFICPHYMESKGYCVINSISVETLKRDAFDAIQLRMEKAQAYQEKQSKFEESELFIKCRKALKTRLEILQRQYSDASNTRLTFYQDVCEGIYSPSDYRAYAKSLEQRLDKLMLEMQNVKHEMDDYDNFKSANCIWVRELLKYKLAQELTDQMYRSLIEKVSAYSGRIELLWKTAQSC